jgi:hypothetical protein
MLFFRGNETKRPKERRDSDTPFPHDMRVILDIALEDRVARLDRHPPLDYSGAIIQPVNISLVSDSHMDRLHTP